MGLAFWFHFLIWVGRKVEWSQRSLARRAFQGGSFLTVSNIHMIPDALEEKDINLGV